jgi:hypothetical protein
MKGNTMNFKRHIRAALALLACTAWAVSAQATLVNRGGGMIYDTTLDITWLQDFNQAQTSGYDSDGFMSWTGANAWAQGLVHGGHDDWRLPTGNSSCDYPGNPPCLSLELWNLYYTELGNVLRQASHTEPFTHLLYEPVNRYAAFWTDATMDIQGRLYATAFHFDVQAAPGSFSLGPGIDFTVPASTLLSAIAVRSGDVASPVPEPQTLVLSLLGLGAVGLARRRQQAAH